MELLKRLGTRKHNSWGLFICPYCNKKAERQIGNGKRHKSCGCYKFKKVMSEEARRKISENHADFSGEKNPFYGKKHTEETIRKISKNRPDFSGEKNPQWKGGITFDRGRKLICVPGHPNPSRARGNYVYEYKLIVEKKLGRYLREGEEVHHKDLDCTNNDPDNLQVMFHGEHSSLYRRLNIEKNRE